VGTAIYPPGWKNEPRDNVGAPENQQHGMSPPFFWAPDSAAVVFADATTLGNDIVLITVDEKATTAAFVYPFPKAVECDGAAAGGKSVEPTGLRHVEFGP
jgi:hypothetical protein